MPKFVEMTALDYALHPEASVGDILRTQKVGEWPGGLAAVTEFWPDPNAEEIPFLVERAGWEIGVFETETIWWYRRNDTQELAENESATA